METQLKSISTTEPKIRGSKLIIDLVGDRHFEISINDIEHLLEWDIAKHCHNLVLSFAQIMAHLLITQGDYPSEKLLGYTPDPDDLYFVNLVAETFSNNKE